MIGGGDSIMKTRCISLPGLMQYEKACPGIKCSNTVCTEFKYSWYGTSSMTSLLLER
jgi:hypothetical protein